MTAGSNVRIGMRHINIYRFTGEVVDSQRSSETSVTAHNNGQVSSRTFHYNEIFLRAADGEERAVEVAGANVPVRAGNTVTVLWGIVGKKEKGSYTTVLNHDTRQIGHIAKPINDLSGPHFYNMLIILFVFVGVFSVMGTFQDNPGSILALLATGGFFFWLLQRRKKLRAAMEAAVADLR